MWFRSRPKTRSPLRATLEIMLVFRQLGKIIRYFPDRIMNDENNPFGSSLNSRTSRGSFMAQRNHPFKSKTVSWPSYDLQNPPRSSLRGNFQGSLRRSIRGLKINENQQIRREEGAEKVIHPTPPLPPRSPTWKETLESVFEAPLDLKRAELQHQLQGEYQLSNCNSKNFDPINKKKEFTASPIQESSFWIGYPADVVGQGHRKSGQLCLVPVLVRSGRQTTDSVFSKIPDSGQNRDRQNADRKTSDRKSGQQTDTGHDFPEIPDKNETRTGHGQYCPPTSAIQSFILDFLWEPSYIFFLKIWILSSPSDWLNVLSWERHSVIIKLLTHLTF